MNNKWKGFIVVVLALAVFAVISSKQHAAQTPAAPAGPSCSASGTGSCSVPTPSAPPAAAKETRTDPPSASGAATQVPSKTAAEAKPAPAPPAATAKKAAPAPKPKALPQMIELGAETCTPCQMMQPILVELRKEYKGQLEAPFWDVRKHPEKAATYDIRVIPTQVFIGADGKEFFRHEGFFPKEDILAKFKEHGIVLRGAK